MLAWTSTVVVSQPVTLSSRAFANLSQTLDALYQAIPGLKSVKFSESATIGVFVYQLEDFGGRKWKQTVDLRTDNVNPTVTLNITDSFKISESAYQRSLFDVLLELVKQFGLTKYEIQFS